MITHEIAAYGYLIAAICFIMALRGLSSPVTSRGGNLYGIVGMVIAIGVTVASPGVVSPWLIVGGLIVGGVIGAVVAMRIQMTALPQLVAAFHSLVGLAAVFVAAAAFISPDAFGIGAPGKIKVHSLIEMGLGTVIGAITFDEKDGKTLLTIRTLFASISQKATHVGAGMEEGIASGLDQLTDVVAVMKAAA